jgi:hypothetical protein
MICLSLVFAAAAVAQTPKLTPSVSADIEMVTVTTLNDGNQLQKTATQRFYRDSQGRTRLENGNVVTINDVVAHEVIVLDLVRRTAQKTILPAPSAASVRAAASEGSAVKVKTSETSPQAGASLGARNINGFDTEGTEMTSIIPANSDLGNKLPIRKTTRIWRSKALQLPILMEIQDPLHGNITMQYKNVQPGALLDPILFQAPRDFTMTQRTAVTQPPASGQFPKP